MFVREAALELAPGSTRRSTRDHLFPSPSFSSRDCAHGDDVRGHSVRPPSFITAAAKRVAAADQDVATRPWRMSTCGRLGIACGAWADKERVSFSKARKRTLVRCWRVAVVTVRGGWSYVCAFRGRQKLFETRRVQARKRLIANGRWFAASQTPCHILATCLE